MTGTSEEQRAAEMAAADAIVQQALVLIRTIPRHLHYRFSEAYYDEKKFWPIMVLDVADVLEQFDPEGKYPLDLRPSDSSVDDVTWLTMLPLVERKPPEWWATHVRAAANCQWCDSMSDYLRALHEYAIGEAVEAMIKEQQECATNTTPTAS